MNRKMILAPMIVFLMLLSIAPVMAAPTDGNKVNAWNTTLGITLPPGAPVIRTDGGITHVYGATSDVYAPLGIGVPLGGTPNYVVWSHSVFNLDWNSKTGVADRHSDAIWYVADYNSMIKYDGAVYNTPDGFSGNVHIIYYGVTYINPSTGTPAVNPITKAPADTGVSFRLVMQGFGKFAGDTLMLSSEGSPPLPPLTGYCLTPG